jgi:predicted transcriptional regulator
MNKSVRNDQLVGESPVEPVRSGAAVAASRALTEFEVQSIDLFVRIAHLVGIPKSVGEIYGLLFTSPGPLSFDDIVESLNMSRGSASQGLRLLRTLGAAKSTYVAGERRDYFLAEIELRKLVTGFLNEQVRPHLVTGEERLALLGGLAAVEPESRREVLMSRVRKLESWRLTTAAALPVVIGMLGEAGNRERNGESRT